jgi:beta-N-acetylhexosaminidase
VASSLRRLGAGCALLAALVALAECSSASGSGPSLERMVGQTLMGSMVGTTPGPELLGRVKRGELGGVILFGANVVSPAQVRSLVVKLQQTAKAGGNPPLLIATDQEGGFVKRFPNGPPFLSPEVMGKTETVAGVTRIGRATGAYLRSAGVSVDLAPVVDVPSSSSSFLGSRAFGKDPTLVARLGTAFAQGVQQARVAATAKHFPGLGTASANTDDRVVVITTSKRVLERRLLPFRSAVSGGARLVMVSNASYPALDPSGLPALLSRPIVTGLLRGQLGFKGVVITDSISAPAPASFGDAPVRALAAGVDILLFSGYEASSATGFRQLVRAVRSGALSRSTLEAADGRIAKLKAWLYDR